MKLETIIVATAVLAFTSCGGGNESGSNDSTTTKEAPKSMMAEEPAEVDPMDNTGIGPVNELVLPAEVDQALAANGEKIYAEKCTACHKPTEKFIGPAPKGILERRNPAWIMNMILNPQVMVKEDPIAKKLLMEFNGSPMANQNLTEDEARAVVEYFRTL